MKTRRTSTILGLVLLALLAASGAGPALAQSAPAQPEVNTIYGIVIAGAGDSYTNLFLNQIFGSLFPSPNNDSQTATVFSSVVGYFNVTILVVAIMALFVNITSGVAQSAHEGKVMGQRWSSLWAPIRILMAFTLMMPVPGLGGYNVAQSMVAYVVKGSTAIASEVWNTAATQIITGVLPVTQPERGLSPAFIRQAYEIESCILLKNAEFENAGSTHRVVLGDGIDIQANIGGVDRVVGTQWTTVVNSSNSSSQVGVCGNVKTPDIPMFLLQRSAGSVSLGSDNQTADDLIAIFHDGHGTSDGYRAIVEDFMADMRRVVEANAPVILDTQQRLPGADGTRSPMATQIQAAVRRADTRVSALNAAIMAQARGVDDAEGNAARNAMLTRITGGCMANAGAAGSVSSVGSDCYGEGWIGAGAWYMSIARLNGEISTLFNATPVGEQPQMFEEVAMLWRMAGYESQQDSRAAVLTDNLNVQNGNAGSGASAGAQAARTDMQYQASRMAEAYNMASYALAGTGISLDPMIGAQLSTSLNGSKIEGNWSWWGLGGGAREKIKEYVNEMILAFSPNTFSTDPMVGVTEAGRILLDMSAILVALDVISSKFNPQILEFALMAAGAFLSIIMPMMPFVFWIVAVTGYFLLVVEAIVAVNLWALAHMRLDGEGISGEAGRNGTMMILALMVTPVLMVIGYLVGMGIFRITLLLVYQAITPMLAGILNNDPVHQIISLVSIVMLLSLFYVMLIERSFSLLATFPNLVMQWIGAKVDVGDVERSRGVLVGGTAQQMAASGAIGNTMAKATARLAGKTTPKAG